MRCSLLLFTTHTYVQAALRQDGVPCHADGWYHALNLHRALQHASDGALRIECTTHVGVQQTGTWRDTLTTQPYDTANSATL